jgi:hypothetical protein
VYVPAQGNTFKLVAQNLNNPVNIKGPNSNDMITLNNISVSNVGSNDIQLQLTVQFKTDTQDTVSTNNYNIWTMVNDYIGFTKFETNGYIKDYNEWTNSNTNWNIDMHTPEKITFSTPTDSDISQIKININTQDDDLLSHVRLDACKTGIDNPDDLTSNLISKYNLKSCNDFSGENINITNDNSLLGTSGNNLNIKSYQQEVIIQLEDNKEGAITFYLTAMDKAGNLIQEFHIYKLEQWAVVKDGFIFGLNGVTSSTRIIEDNEWLNHTILENFQNNYKQEIDLTNHVLLGAKSLSSIFLRELVNTNSNNSFTAANYPGIFLGLPYQELLIAYRKKANSNAVTPLSIGNLTNNISQECTSTSYCILEASQDITITNLLCDQKTLISVDGNVILEPDLTNNTNQDTCIILASGNITIKPGERHTLSSENIPQYNTIQAFLIAGGQIHIETEGNNNDDGLYVEGGLISFATEFQTAVRSSVYNQREINYSYMGMYPVLVVDNNAKYGLFGKQVFGSQIDIFKTEVGFKPY